MGRGGAGGAQPSARRSSPGSSTAVPGREGLKVWDPTLGFPLAALKMLRNCLGLFAPHVAHAHVMSF